MSATTVVHATTSAGNPCLRALDEYGIAVAAAICVGGRGRVLANATGGPRGELIAGSEADAREWVMWLGGQLADTTPS